MASRKDRFAQLAAPEGDSATDGRTADLFEHYGIAVDPAMGSRAVTAVDAKACRRCGWFLSLDAAQSCPLCGEPRPHAEEKPATS